MRIDIWSDVVCPWCYIGKRRLEAALAMMPELGEVELVWHSFQLDPTATPGDATPLVQKLARKYGRTVEQAQAMMDQVTATGAADGLGFRFDIAQSANTLKAHGLLHLALRRGLQEPVKERLMKAYFCEGGNLNDTDTLVDLVAEAGLDPDEAREAVQNEAFAEDVAHDIQQARQIGITGVPFFVFNQRYAVSGAQPAATLVEVMRKAAAH